MVVMHRRTQSFGFEFEFETWTRKVQNIVLKFDYVDSLIMLSTIE